MKLLYFVGLMMFVKGGLAICPMQNSLTACNNDPMGCGWDRGMCVSCPMTRKPTMCGKSHFCEWNSDMHKCMKKDMPPKDCGMYTMMSNCQMDDECKWKGDQCVRKLECRHIKSKKRCKRRSDCRAGALGCTTRH